MNSAGTNGAEAGAADGAVVYARACQGCHGEAGSGVEGSGPELTHTATTGEDKLREIIENGSEDKKMPAFKDQLSEEEITAVIAHIRTLGGAGAATGGETGHEGHNHPPGEGH
ncbi:MAG: c-type cytochrome [Armatimonadota bacterium]